MQSIDLFQPEEPDVAHKWLVLGPPHVLLLPASVAEVVEAGEIPGSREHYESKVTTKDHARCLMQDKTMQDNKLNS